MKSVLKSNLVPLGAIFVTCAAAGIQPAYASGEFDVYLSAPASQTTIFTNTLTETFEEFSPGVYTSPLVTSIGTYQVNPTSKLAVVANDQYGANTGNYVALGAQSSSSAPVTLQLSSPHSYFGFSWNAGDPNNELSFYNGNVLVGYYSTATVTGLLSNPTVTALNGNTYQSSDYHGQPGTGNNSGEPYAFINFIDNAGTFDRVVFGNSNTTSTGFESDNHTIRVDAPGPSPTFVSVGFADTPNTVTPEPGTLALLTGLGLTGSLCTFRRRKPRK